MKKFLFIAEKPSSMREFQSVYKKHKYEVDNVVGGSIDFIALRGHVFRNLEPKEYDAWDKKWVQLYESDLPMIPKTWKVTAISGAQDAIKALKDKLKEGYDGIIVGTDSDVEGYGIYYMVYQAMNLKNYKTLRFYETALTEKNILQSFRDMDDLFATPRHKNALNSYIFRSRWDWLIGMNLTTAYTVRYGELMKIGSVKAPTLKLIYDNCWALDNFKELITWGVKSLHTDGFESILLNDDNNKEKSFQQKADAEALVKTLAPQAIVKSYDKKTEYKKAPKLYSLSDLQVEAAKAPYGYTPDQTLATCQKLYEERKILTYPRTSGNYLASGKTSDIPDIMKAMMGVPDLVPFVSKLTPADITKQNKNTDIFNDKEAEKAAHDALIPTGEAVNWSALTKPEQDIFMLVCKRLLAHYLPYFTEEKTSIMLDNNGNRFKATGRRTIENGYYDLYGKTVADKILPEYKVGAIVKIEQSIPYEKKSSPPARYSTGSIIEAMKNIASQVTDPELKKVMRESEGIGTEATRAGILLDLQKSGYIETKKNMIYITDQGRRYIENIRTPKGDGFDYGIADPVKVAYWSSKAKEIQLGEAKVEDILTNFYDYLEKTIAMLKMSGAPEKRGFTPAKSETNVKCPVCGSAMLNGKFGFYCSNREKCKVSVPKEYCGKTLTEKQQINLLQGKKVHAKGFKSKAGKDFEADLYLDKNTGKLAFDFSKK